MGPFTEVVGRPRALFTPYSSPRSVSPRVMHRFARPKAEKIFPSGTTGGGGS